MNPYSWMPLCGLSMLWVATAWAKSPDPMSCALLPRPERTQIPQWAKPGYLTCAQCAAGPIEVRKAVLSQWEAMRLPDAALACETFFNDQTIHMLQNAHINWIFVTWSNGFSFETEARQREILGPWIAKCRKAGIHVAVYISLTNMFMKDMSEHVPASKSWMQIEANGSPRPYGKAKENGQFNRILACLNNPAWLEYSKQRISSALAAGADGGIFFDNGSHACKCPLCRKKFAEYTTARFGHPLPVPGLASDFRADNKGGEAIADKRSDKHEDQAWKDFCSQTLADAITLLRRYAESLEPGIFVSANTHQQPFTDEVTNWGLTEDGLEPCIFQGRMNSNLGLYRYLYAFADGWKPTAIENGQRVYAHRNDKPMPPRSQKLSVFEAAACQMAHFSFFEMGWTTQLYHGEKFAHDAVVALGEANAWMQAHASLFTDVEPIARTALVVQEMRKADSALALVAAGKHFNILLTRQLTPHQLKQYPLVVLNDVRYLSQPQRSALVDYVRQGGHLLVTGQSGFFDADSWSKLNPPGLSELFSGSSTRTERLESCVGQGKVIYNPETAATEAGLRDWAILEGEPMVAVHAASGTVAFNLARTWDGRHMRLYVLNYADQPVQNVDVILHLPLAPKSLRVHTPGMEASAIKSSAITHGLELQIPQIDQFSVVEGDFLAVP